MLFIYFFLIFKQVAQFSIAGLNRDLYRYNNITIYNNITTLNLNLVAQYRKEKAKGDYKDLKRFFECFFEFEKKNFVPYFGGQEIPYFDCVNPEGALIFKSTD